MKKLFLLVLICGTLFSCKQKDKNGKNGKGDTVVTLDIKNIPAQKVTLFYSDGKNPAVIADSTSYAGDNKPITFNTQVDEESYLQITFEKDRNGPHYLPIVTHGEKINFTGDYNQFDAVKVSGSPATEELLAYFHSLYARITETGKLQSQMDSLYNANAPEAVIKEKEKELTEKMNAGLNEKIAFAKKTTHPVSAVMGLMSGTMSNELPMIKDEVEAIVKKYDQSTYVKNFYDVYKQMTAPRVPPPTTNPASGEMAKEISLPDVNGKTVSLSSFKGKYVLIDFWASWCGPCRGENPNVVAAYNKFKDKNFTILGVSLDKAKDAWVKAIKDDGLTWTHVSDLQYWSSQAARDYGVQSIPANFLVDPSGKIIARDLRGEELEQQLAAVLK